ncbi:cytochrome C oxidase subunit II [Oceanobacillus sp. 143]|uniref:Cytochrome C oxidase subunit II n=1 Tax=Oceanobacillus zhaokaii TaxID=2052660 RepID=A0A345PJL5_9BACI|nr:cupredoxin domain-containing protein [Oceanobacillus zhaokaii]AXI10195.1 cytochrome C oxidase subunit II [Oceanobacillus zhaokaii]QGS69291.1 cytochrome C oxidase subunit II [Oceanobacillus sp. 143]
MKEKFFGVLIASLFVLLLTACGGDTSDTDQGANQEESGKVVEITIHATNFEFDQDEISVNKGDRVKLTLVSDSGTHGIEVEGYDVTLLDGETIEFVADEVGTFEFYCNILCGVGHDSMAGNLVVS